MLGETLTFRPHIDKVCASMEQRKKVTKTLACAYWGANTQKLRMFRVGHTQSKADFGIAAYGVFANARDLSLLETQQNEGAHVVSGCTRDSSVAMMLQEADQPPLWTWWSYVQAAGRAPTWCGCCNDGMRLRDKMGTVCLATPSPIIFICMTCVPIRMGLNA